MIIINIKLEPSIYLTEEGNKLRQESPFIDGLFDIHNFSSLTKISEEDENDIEKN